MQLFFPGSAAPLALAASSCVESYRATTEPPWSAPPDRPVGAHAIDPTTSLPARPSPPAAPAPAADASRSVAANTAVALGAAARGELPLLGLDFGSTTSAAMLAVARVLRNCASGRMELGEPTVLYRSEPVFTPFAGDALDEAAIARLLDGWFTASGVSPGEIRAGGAIITGLAARRANADAILRLVRARVPDALVAVADDPALESWLAFMGSCRGLSLARPDLPFVNLDIGGGTTNLALGRAGEVLATGCLWVGARHVRVQPGTYRILALSPQAAALFAGLAIRKGPGDELAPAELDRLLACWVGLLEAAVRGERAPFLPAWAAALEALPFRPPSGGGTAENTVITVSGGVGELIYQAVRGVAPLPPTTRYGDLGIDLARAVARSPLLARNLGAFVPANLGRATVYGLTLFSTEVSGATVWLPRPELLPLRDLPIVARLDGDPAAVRGAVERAARGGRGACLQLTSCPETHEELRRLGGALAAALRDLFPADRTLVLLAPRNVGKTLGSYASDWGRTAAGLIVIDELADRRAHFVALGAPVHGSVPVTFYGIE